MKGFVISTENKMQFKDFNEPLLLSIGTEICGYSETVHPKYLPEGFCMVVNDEGLLRGAPAQSLCQPPLRHTGARPAHRWQRGDSSGGIREW